MPVPRLDQRTRSLEWVDDESVRHAHSHVDRNRLAMSGYSCIMARSSISPQRVSNRLVGPAVLHR